MTTTYDSHANVLLEKLQTLEEHLDALQDQLIRAQRLAALGTMAGMIAHEFNNLLTPVVSYSQFAAKQEDPELWRKALLRASENGQKAADVAQQILAFARGNGNGERTEVAAVVDGALKALVRDLSKDNIDVKTELAPAAVSIPGHLLQQVLYNLLLNARQAMLGRGGKLTIRSAVADGHVRIDVSDTGCGIAPDVLPRIFDPFFTTKSKADRPDMQGTGLGLAVSRHIILQAGGTLDAQSKPGKGSTFTITLPLA